jgi:hypothetical protein
MCLIKDGDQVACTVHLDQAKRLFMPIPPWFGEISDPESENSDTEEN